MSTSLTYSGWPSSDSSYNRSVRVYSRKNGNQFLNWALSSNVDWITISGSGAGATFKVATNNSSSSRTGIITFTLQMQLPAPNLEVAKRVADEAQRLIDIYGYYNFLNLVEFMKQNPSMVQMGLSLINKNNAVWKK